MINYFKNLAAIFIIGINLVSWNCFATSFDIGNTTKTSTGVTEYYGTGDQKAGLANSNYISNYTQIYRDITEAKASGESQDSSSGDGNDYVTPGFFYRTPSIKCTLSGCKTNYFEVCFEDSWKVYAPQGNTIFDPKIKVRSILVISCLGLNSTATLSAYGQCKMFNGFKRACARFAPPCKFGNNYCCTGSTCNGNYSKCPGCEPESKYRICAYYDPMDVNDWNMGSMPFHLNSPVPPEVTGGDSVMALGAFIFTIGLMVPGLGFGAMMMGLWIMQAGGVMELIEFITSTINYWVIDNVGCIDVPLAPSPPPFFQTIVPPIPNATVTSLCQYSPEYYLDSDLQAQLRASGLTPEQIARLNNVQTSTADALCEVGGTAAAPQYSTFENPAVRIYFSNQMPFCTGGGSPVADTCTMGIGISDPDTLQSTNLGLLPICSEEITFDCVSFPSGRKIGGPFRAYFKTESTQNLGVEAKPSTGPYFKTNPSLEVMTVAGIDDSQYADVAAGNETIFFDPNSNQRRFYVGLSASGKEVCVTDKTNSNNQVSLGCVPRPIPMSPPVVSSCLNSDTCGYDSNISIQDQPRFTVSIGSPAKTAIMGVDTTIPDPNSDSNPPNSLAPQAFCYQDDITTNGTSKANPAPCYIYGAQFSAYITDNNNTTPNSTSDGTITPTYVDGSYSGGIQYSQGAYCRGATKICLTGYSNPEQQVVAKMVQVQDSASGTVQYVVSDLISDRVIPPSNAALPLAASSLFNPDTDYITSTSQPTYVAYGFQNSGQYFENSTCSTNGNSCIATSTNYPSKTSCECTIEGVKTPCSITGCEWAFLQNSPNAQITYIGYTDGVNRYMMNDTNGNPLYGLRPLNSLEQGVCADIPQPSCGAVSNPGPSDGGASWPSAIAGQTVTGTCLNGTEMTGGRAPTRKCVYPDLGTLANGCPIPSSPAFTSVTNPCSYRVPSWWPSEFLYGNTDYKGAIINHFNIMPDYMTRFRPRHNNHPQVYASGNNIAINTPVESWIDSRSFNSCKNYGENGIQTSRVSRTYADADQEMLFISRDGWRTIWSKDWNGDGNNNDLTWLLDDSSSNNGCYVYNVNDLVFADVSGIQVGLKICKYNNKISFALVDIAGIVDYTNINYIMQSNLIYYDKQASAALSGSDHQLEAKTLLENTVTSLNAHFINNGIVVDKNGFNYNVASNLELSPPPAGFVRVETAESVQVLYGLAAIYKYRTSRRGYERYDVYDQNTGVKGTSGSYQTPAYYSINPCALAAYRRGVNYSQNLSNTSYFAFPTTPVSRYPRGDRTYPSSYRSPFISSLYVYTSYNGGNSESDWPYSNNCQMRVKIQNLVRGNSAMNANMFLWSAPNSYNVCNQ